jgi:hypothetical protein
MPRRAAPPNGPLVPLTRRLVASLDAGDVGEGVRPSVCRDPDEGALAPEWAHGGAGVTVGGHCFQLQPSQDPRDEPPAPVAHVMLVNREAGESAVPGRYRTCGGTAGRASFVGAPLGSTIRNFLVTSVVSNCLGNNLSLGGYDRRNTYCHHPLLCRASPESLRSCFRAQVSR